MKPLLIVLAALSLVALIAASTLPRRFSVSRSATIHRPLAEVFAYTLDLNNRQHWTAWAERAPNVRYVVEGNGRSAGSRMSWKDADIGEGNVTVTAVEPHARIVTRLQFVQPFQMVSEDSLLFEEVAGGTKVTWLNEGELHGPQRVMGLFLDRMIGPDYARGLSNLKARMEGGGPTAALAPAH